MSSNNNAKPKSDNADLKQTTPSISATGSDQGTGGAQGASTHYKNFEAAQKITAPYKDFSGGVSIPSQERQELGAMAQSEVINEDFTEDQIIWFKYREPQFFINEKYKLNVVDHKYVTRNRAIWEYFNTHPAKNSEVFMDKLPQYIIDDREARKRLTELNSQTGWESGSFDN